jgi:hypothetical protein
VGSRPFLLGWRLWLEQQRGLSNPLVWRVRPEALTQAGGHAWALDAVALLRAHTHRRRELEPQPEDASPHAPPSPRTATEAAKTPEWCVAIGTCVVRRPQRR